MCSWRAPGLGAEIDKLFVTTDYQERIRGYQELAKRAVEIGATIPLLQSVITIARNKSLNYTPYANGWVLAKTASWAL
jgi:peptide/nickel transport system substrate-binding protein